MEMTLQKLYSELRNALSPITEVPEGEKALIGKEICRLDDIRSKVSVAALSAAALSIIFWPPYNFGSIALGGAYVGFEVQQVARNLQSIYLESGKRVAAKANREDLLRLLTENTVVAKRVLPYLLSDSKVVQLQNSIPGVVEGAG